MHADPSEEVDPSPQSVPEPRHDVALDDMAPDGVAPDGSTVVAGGDTASAPLPPPTADRPTEISADDVPNRDHPTDDDRMDDDAGRSSVGDPVLVGVTFDGRIKAQEFLLAMGRLRQQGDLDLQDAVIVDKNDAGKTSVTETIDPSPGKAAMSGAVWTGLLGLFLGGPVGWLAGLGVGAGVGAVTAKVVDLGVPDEWVAWFRDAVRPSSSTVVLLLDHINMPVLIAEAERFTDGELVHSTMPGISFDDLARAFEPRRDRS